MLDAGYMERSQQPLQALLFLLPLLILYEVAAPMLGGAQLFDAASDIYARRLLYRFFNALGVTGFYLPGIIVVVVLLCMHVARRDPWRAEPKLYILMWGEALAEALPLFVFQMMLFRQGVLAAAPAIDAGSDWPAQMVFAVGAGIYEELLFRLIAITLLHLLLADLLAIPNKYALPLCVVLSSILFAAYHFSEVNPFSIGKFLFYTGAGLYFALLLIKRGFGLAAAAHALYDVLVVILQQMQQP